MTEQPRRPIVVGIDESDISSQAVRWAAQEAERRQLPIKLLRADEWIPGEPMLGTGDDSVREHSHRLLAAATHAVREQSGDVEITTAVSTLSAAGALVEESREASMVVVGCRGRGGFSGLLLGSTSLALVAHAHCPVVVVRGARSASTGQVGRIVVGVDNSPAAEVALAFAVEEASVTGAEVVAIHCWQIEGYVSSWAPIPLAVDWTAVIAAEQNTFRRSATAWREKFPDVGVDLKWEQGDPTRVLANASADADLIVVGSRGRGPLGGLLLGSVSQGLLHESSCPVAVIPHVDD